MERKYNQEELRIIRQMKVHYFGAYLQYCWFSKYILKDKEVPPKAKLQGLLEKMQDNWNAFEVSYSHILPRARVNPLVEEQTAWNRLSPDLERFIGGFSRFVKDYSPDNLTEEDKCRLDLYVDIWWALHQEWNNLSNSYKPKLEQTHRSSDIAIMKKMQRLVEEKLGKR